MSLTKQQRAALADSDFACPSKRLLPMHDANHVKMAWSVSASARGLTDDERAEARARLIVRASELGVDTSGWRAAAGPDPGLYVRRNLTPDSAATFIAWAQGQGFTGVMPASELHVTIVHSTQSVPIRPAGGSVLAQTADRSVQALGDKGAVVLMFGSEDLTERWREAMGLGAAWDWDSYRPHVTITYDAGDLDLEKIEPFAGDLVFGPEIHETLTDGWAKDKGLRFEAMALDLPVVDGGHPNAMPFSGVLVRLDQPSDAPPHGADGKRVLLTTAAAQAALPSLLGQGVNFTEDVDSPEAKARGHAVSRKVGVITGATVRAGAVHIDGIIYAADFPGEAARIRRDKSLLGFSFEATRIHVETLSSDPLVITACVFTGAAILRKDKAAYTTTSLAAAAAGDIEMTKEELEAILAAALAPVTAEIEALKAAGQAKAATQVELNKQADSLAASAAALRAAGVSGADALDLAAADLRAGKTTIGLAASAAPAAVVDPAIAVLRDEVAVLTTKLADKLAAGADAGAGPERKTISPTITQLLAKAGVTAPEGEAKIAAAVLDKALAASGMDVRARLTLKTELSRAGLLAA